jgi:hypothetical protein
MDRWSGGENARRRGAKDRGLLPNCRSFIDGLGGKEQRRLRSWEGGGTGEDGGVGVGRSGLFGFAHEARRSLRCSRGSTHMRGPGAWTGAARRPRRALRAVGACVSSPRRLAGPPRRQAKKARRSRCPLACLSSVLPWLASFAELDRRLGLRKSFGQQCQYQCSTWPAQYRSDVQTTRKGWRERARRTDLVGAPPTDQRDVGPYSIHPPTARPPMNESIE